MCLQAECCLEFRTEIVFYRMCLIWTLSRQQYILLDKENRFHSGHIHCGEAVITSMHYPQQESGFTIVLCNFYTLTAHVTLQKQPLNISVLFVYSRQSTAVLSKHTLLFANKQNQHKIYSSFCNWGQGYGATTSNHAR